jgi:hypothetical protein
MDSREEHMRTALILSRTAEMLAAALKGVHHEEREEAYDVLASARRRCAEVDTILWPDKESQ